MRYLKGMEVLGIGLAALLATFVLACGDEDTEADTRQEYEAEVEEQLNLIDDRIEDVESKIRDSDVPDEARQELESLKDERRDVEQKLQEVRQAGEDRWPELKSEIDESLDDLGSGIEALGREIDEELSGGGS